MKKLVALIFCVFFLSTTRPSLAQNSECQCLYNGTTKEWYVATDLCWLDQKPAYCVEGGYGDCKCTTTTPNTCGTDYTGAITFNHCKGDTPTACISIPYGSYECTCLSACPTPTPKPKAASCQCDGNLNVIEPDSCGAKTPVCGGRGVYASCTCLDNLPTTKPVAGSNTDGDNNYLCSDGLSVDTALGCIPVQMDKFIAWLLPILFSISGGIAFLLMVYGFILITTSKGDPKAIQGARETITSAIIGLLISIFAIFILRLITVDILKIPGIS